MTPSDGLVNYGLEFFRRSTTDAGVKYHRVTSFSLDDTIKIQRGEYSSISESEPRPKDESEGIPGITGKGDLSSKPHPSAISPHMLEEVSNTFRFGANKHGKNNFRKMTSEASQEIWDALFRHLLAYQKGETHAKDSNCHHLSHAVANISMLYRIISREGDSKVLSVITGGDHDGKQETNL